MVEIIAVFVVVSNLSYIGYKIYKRIKRDAT